MGLRALRRKTGEYLIFTDNNGWGGKNNFFRWQPWTRTGCMQFSGVTMWNGPRTRSLSTSE